MLTIRDRAELYTRAFPKWRASWPTIVQEDGHDVLYARWLIGARWGNLSKYFGAYPRTYLDRMMAMFPTEPQTMLDPGLGAGEILHAFSGSLPPGPYTRLDIREAITTDDGTVLTTPDVVGSVYDVDKLFFGRRPFRLVFADPPYSKEHAQRYGTPMIDRARALRALATVVKPHGFLIWLDLTWPLHRKTQWTTVGRIAIVRSTGHHLRDATIFQRTAYTSAPCVREPHCGNRARVTPPERRGDAIHRDVVCTTCHRAAVDSDVIEVPA